MNAKINYQNSEAIFVDYTWCKGTEDQLATLEDYRIRVLAAKTERVIVIVEFTGQIASKQLIRQAVRVLNEIKHRIDRFIVVGVFGIQGVMIETINLITGADIEIFETLKRAEQSLEQPSQPVQPLSSQRR